MGYSLLAAGRIGQKNRKWVVTVVLMNPVECVSVMTNVSANENENRIENENEMVRTEDVSVGVDC